MSPSFAALGLSPALLRATSECGYVEPTPIEAAAIPAALRGRDVIGCARTGSGKTAAFGLALLQRIEAAARPGVRRTAGLVLVPTRELALQVGLEIRALARGAGADVRVAVLFGGVSVNPQMMDLRGGAEVVVATPGRLLDLVARNALQLDAAHWLVLDEADRMLDEGFADELARITDLLPRRRQGLFFSATFPPAVLSLAQALLRDPLRIDLPAHAEPATPVVEQHAIEVDVARRTPLLRHLLQVQGWERVLVFVATRHACEHVADKLRRHGIAAAAFHGELGQGARAGVLADLNTGALRVVLATDIAARGLHIPGLSAVVNYDLPRSPADYTHRIGRTARAGSTGVAVSFVDAAGEAHFRLIEKRCGQRVPRERIAGFERSEVPPLTAHSPASPRSGTGGVKGRRKSRKDKLREAAGRERAG